LSIPYVRSREDELMVVTLLSHRDLIMYLLAIKSLLYYMDRGQISVISDGSLTQEDKELLSKHVKDISISNISDIENTNCPKGGCWERLLCVADYNKDKHVLVLDADILIQSQIEEIIEGVNNDSSLIMGLTRNQDVKFMPEILAEEKKNFEGRDLTNAPVQVFYDTNLDKIHGYESRRYLKGSGGFNMFARGSINREAVECYSNEMKDIFKKRWDEWGTEQIAACYLIANTPNAKILPFPKYAIYYGNEDINYEFSSVLHFVGTYRFHKQYYADVATRFIRRVGK